MPLVPNSMYNNGFEKSGLGDKLEGEELMLHLKESNFKLTKKVNYYRKESEVFLIISISRS